jgi:hypothetical protein
MITFRKCNKTHHSVGPVFIGEVGKNNCDNMKADPKMYKEKCTKKTFVLLLPLWAVVACSRVTFTFTLVYFIVIITLEECVELTLSATPSYTPS